MAVQAETLRELTAERLQFISAALARKAANEYSEGNPDIADASLRLGVDIAETRQRLRVELTEIAARLRGLGLDDLEGTTISPPVVPAKENLPPENPYGKLWIGLGRKPVNVYAMGTALFSLNENGTLLHKSKDEVVDAANLGSHPNFQTTRIDLRDKMLKIGEEECLTIFSGLNKCLEIARKEVPNRPFADCLQYLMYDRFYPPSRTESVSSQVRAKCCSLRRDSAPDEARGEDTPTVRSWELHGVEKEPVESATEPNKRNGQRQETLVRELFALNEEQTGLRHQDFNQVVESAYADKLKGIDGQRREKQIRINQSSGYQSRNLIRSRIAMQGEEWVVFKYPDVKTFLVWARQQPQFAKMWSFLDLVDYGLRLKKVEVAITPVQPVVETPIIAPSPNGAVAETEQTIYSAPLEPKTEPEPEQPSVTINNSTYFHLLTILREVDSEKGREFNLSFTREDRSLIAIYHSRLRSVLSLRDLSREGINILIQAVRLLQNKAMVVNEVAVAGVESSKILAEVAKSNADFINFIRSKRKTFKPSVQVVERVEAKEAPKTLKLSTGERFWLVKAACELPPADYRFSGIPDSHLPTNTWRLRIGEEVLGLLSEPILLEQKDEDIESLREKIWGAYCEGRKSEFFHANSAYKAKEVLELLFSIDDKRSFATILDRLIEVARKASTDKVVVDPNWMIQARHMSPSIARQA
ncbi:MAG: hypothetical protein G01um10145_520 [Microgenomates group bacterium Gr01-1014_5]|nr:MAG: hypothetical protein G01um10145_520 [Microgenomates group bacterium Gr01-1014_5]